MKRKINGQCLSCRYVTEVTDFAWDINCEEDKHRPPMLLCELCANTPAGTALQYPHGKDRHTLQTLCWIGNCILDEIRKGNS